MECLMNVAVCRRLAVLLLLTISGLALAAPATYGGVAAVRTLPSNGASAASNPDTESDITDINPVLVIGQYSGPALWKVSKGDNTLWILGTVSPVPKGMDWYSPQAESVLAQAQEVIGAPGGFQFRTGSMLKMTFAVPTLMRARKNPDGKTLRDVLPADVYAHWSALKPMYPGSDKAVEQWRPVFAAGHLHQLALRRSGLADGTGVGKRISELTKARRIKYTSILISAEVKDPKGLAKSFARAELDDVQCFRSVLERIELDVANAAQRANAWASGNIAELTRLFRLGDGTPCFDALANTEAARSLGIDDAVARGQQLWLQAAESALAANHTTFSTLPVGELLLPRGLLARLQAKGYEVTAPE